jgi:hypothetical protein
MSSSVIGSKFPNIVCCSARKLHCKSKRLVQSYDAELDMLCNRHKMYQRIYFIHSNIDSFFDEEFLYLMNNWAKELVQFRLHLEVNCTKFKMCHIKWSPEVGFWFSRRWLLARVKVYVMGLEPPDPRNLIKDCHRLHLFNPRCIFYSDIMIHTKIAHHKLLELAKDAPALHCQHHLDLQKAADKRGDSTQSAVILEILTQEQKRKKWRRINYTTQPPQGGNPLTICV